MAPPLLYLRDIRLTFGGDPLLDGASLSVSQGERVCLIGRNGSGKSTLLKIAAGLIEPDAGERFVQPGTTVRYMHQEPDFDGFDTVLDYARSALEHGDTQHRAQYLLDHLGLDGGQDPKVMSGGELRRAELARVLAPQPDILLLDEPTNHLDLPAIEWLENEISRMRSAVVLISHDRRFLENLSRATLWLDRGKTRLLQRGFKAFEAWRDDILEREQVEAHKLARKIVREEHWLRYGVTARRKRNVKRLGDLGALRAERVTALRDLDRASGKVAMKAGEGGLSGKLVIEAENLTKAFDGRIIVDHFSTRILRGDRVGIIGANGAGKTTLLNMLTGKTKPDSGHIRLGAGLEMVSLDQRRDQLDPALTLRETLTGGGSDMIPVAGEKKHVVAYMKDFLFTPEQAGTPISELSGGERGRVMLALALAKPSNLLVLDEPTNDLDLETLELLQELLSGYRGTVLLISHDRDFLDRTVTSVISTSGNGVWTEYAGGFSQSIKAAKGETGGARRKLQSKQRPSSSPPAAASSARKLSFREKHALETLPKRMDELEKAVETFKQALSDTQLFAKDPERYNRLAENLARAERELQRAEEQWLELEMLREEIEGDRAG